MQDREELVDDLFAQASDLEPAARPEFFAARLGDDALLADGVIDEVCALLDANDGVYQKGFLQQPLIEDEGEQANAFIGQPLDGYTILSLIAEGGMGQVYLARDEELNCEVAVKIVRSGGYGRKSLIRRFHAERRILAQLKHPNIAKIFKGGATEDGLPYLVMEYIDGQAIIEYADEHKLNTGARLELFRKVCAAVTYAHQHLVVHRDIKPSNVLVTNEGEPKLLDFGIAKLLDPASTASETVTGVCAMTPEYASPEQIKGETVTTATDVYSLGVLLYELLAGRHPYREKFRNAGALEHAICKIEPERPSTFVKRIKSSEDATARSEAETNESRASEKAALARRRDLRGDLDNIALMALRKDPARRYASVGQFSEDIRRHLAGLPVIARKDTFKYRAQKFVKRNIIGVVTAALVAFALIGGIIVATWQAHVARVERAKTERVFKDVRQLANSLVFDVHEAIRDLPGATHARELLVRHATEYLDRVAQEAGSGATLQSELAIAYMKVGDVQGMPYEANLGDTDGAIRSYSRAVTLLEAVTAGQPNNTDARHSLSTTYQRLGAVQSISGKWRAGLESQRKATNVCEALLKIDPANAEYKILSGQSYSSLGDALSSAAGVERSIEYARQALESYRKALVVREASFNAAPTERKLRAAVMQGYERVGFGYIRLGEMDGDTENFRQTLENFRLSQQHRETLFAAYPSSARIKRIVADGQMNIGIAQHFLHNDSEALESYRKALPSFEALAASDPNNVEAQRDLFYLHSNMTIALAGMNDARGALTESREALPLLERLREADPRNVDDRLSLLRLYDAIGDALRASGDSSGAMENYRKGLTTIEAWRADEPENKQVSQCLAKEYANIGSVYERMTINAHTNAKKAEGWREARTCYAQSLKSLQALRGVDNTLNAADAAKVDEVTTELARCDAALAQASR